MKVLPTLEGGLRVDLEAGRDWVIFEQLVWDARGKQEGWLSKKLGSRMEDEDWAEFVMPELEGIFASQIETVLAGLKTAKENEENGEAHFFILPEEGGAWYGVLNQARLSLESEWKLGDLEEVENLEEVEEKRLGAYFRARFYLLLQSKLLDHVMD
ncbi:MAG: hypothetical protein Q7Q71_13580 [Verrucomicrobiota bacterium JB023]|nr:hypothetical protein [Verrucomicrobiota bacterium JB023]